MPTLSSQKGKRIELIRAREKKKVYVVRIKPRLLARFKVPL